MDLQALNDKIEIHELLCRYARAVDTRDWELWKSVFTPDAAVDYSSAGFAAGSRDAVAAQLQQALDPAPMMQHLVTNVEVDLDGDRAKVQALVFNPRQLGGMAELSFGGGRYHHDLVRTEDGWRSEKLVEEHLWHTANTPVRDGA